MTSNTSSADLQLASLPDQSLTSSEAVGVAVFEDDRVAFKRFVVSSAGGDEGSFIGLSTYTFQNGDALTLKFTGNWTAQGEVGTYEVLSGTGAFEDATGVGRFESVDHAWEDAGLFDGSFTLEVPGT